MIDFSQDFQRKDPSLININNGTLGLCPDVVIDAQIEELKKYEFNTSASLGGSWPRLWEVQKQLGLFLNASPEDLFLRPNITVVLNDLILGLTLPAKSEILSFEFEYGAIVNILKKKCEDDSLSLRLLKADLLLKPRTTKNNFLNYLESELRPETKLVVISHIFTGTGHCVPLVEMQKLLASKGILLIVDGAHGPGAMNIDFKNELKDLDFYSGNLHKWTMGPKGTAFGWVNPSKQHLLKPLMASWTYYPDIPVHYQMFSHAGSFASRMLWSHSQAFSAYFALEKCFSYWNRYGKEVLFQEIQKRAQWISKELGAAGLFHTTYEQEDFFSPLLCYKLEQFDESLFKRLLLELNGVRVQIGRPQVPDHQFLRISAHIHNTQAELALAVDCLKLAVSK